MKHRQMTTSRRKADTKKLARLVAEHEELKKQEDECRAERTQIRKEIQALLPKIPRGDHKVAVRVGDMDVTLGYWRRSVVDNMALIKQVGTKTFRKLATVTLTALRDYGLDEDEINDLRIMERRDTPTLTIRAAEDD